MKKKQKNKIVLFGFGGIADQAIFYHGLENEILCYVDSDPEKWGLTKAGITVCGPQILDDLEFDGIVITSEYREEIKAMLIGKGIEPSKITCFPLIPNLLQTAFSLPISLLMTPVNFLNFLRSLWAHIKCLKASFSDLPPLPGVYLFAVNTLFWMYSTEQTMKNGIHGISKHMGTGNYQLSNLWFNVPLSQVLFRFLGVNYSAFSILFLPLPFVLTANDSIPFFPFALLFFLLFSSPITQSIAFVVGRYHNPAWIFFCFFLLTFNEGSIILSSLFLLGISLFSTTVLFISVIASISLLGDSSWQFLIITMIPCFVYIGAHVLYVLIRSKKISYKYFLNTFKGIGVIKKKAKYKRLYYNLSNTDKYLIICYTGYLSLYLYYFQNLPLLSCLALVTLITNSKLFRFFDTQTVHFFLFLTLLIEFALCAYNPLHAVAILPFCLMPSLYKTGSISDSQPIRVFNPIDLNKEIQLACDFLEPIPENSRILVLFKDPGNNYEKIFNGFRESLELLLYAGIKKKLIIFPNWQAIFQNNQIDDPGFWVNSENNISSLAKIWNFDYIIFNKNEEYKFSFPYTIVTNKSLHFNLIEYDEWSRRNFKVPSWEIAKLY